MGLVEQAIEQVRQRIGHVRSRALASRVQVTAQALPVAGQFDPIVFIHVVIDHLGIVAAVVIIQPRLAHPHCAFGQIDCIAGVVQIVGLEHDAVGKYVVDKAFLGIEIRRAFERAVGVDDALER
jgi:hypothetical protein